MSVAKLILEVLSENTSRRVKTRALDSSSSIKIGEEKKEIEEWSEMKGKKLV